MKQDRGGPAKRPTPPPFPLRSTALFAALSRTSPVAPVSIFRFGAGHLYLQSDDQDFHDRIVDLYPDCRVSGSGGEGSRVHCAITSDAEQAVGLVRFRDGRRLDQVAFANALFGERGYWELPERCLGWRFLASEAAPDGVFGFAGDDVLVNLNAPWQRFIGNLALGRVLRLQQHVLFFHAAAVSVGERGVLLLGPKGAGKTTLSLALAARGHSLLGDELIGVQRDSLELIPVRRSVSVRRGPMGKGVRQALGRAASNLEHFPDGSTRERAAASSLFPSASRSRSALEYVMLIGGRARVPRLERIQLQRQHIPNLSLLGVSVWGERPGRRAVQVLELLARVPIFSLTVGGTPDETADLLERVAEE